MLLHILGASAGGGLPQWNCACPRCQAAREGRIRPLTQSSIAVRAEGGPWFLVNASPDVRQQLERLRDGYLSIRSSPIAGVILTDAEIDHTSGLMILRESEQPLKVYGTATVKQALSEGFPVLRTLTNYCGVDWSVLEADTSLSLTDRESAMQVEVFPLSTKPPKYMGQSQDDIWAIGLTFRDVATGGVLTYAPVLSELTDSLRERFESSDCILVDGTFWRNDELQRLGISGRTAQAMGHLPLGGSDGSLQPLKMLNCPRKILIHINNTNPIHQTDSEERMSVEAAGIEVGYDGMIIKL